MDIDKIKIEFAIEQLVEIDNVLVSKTKVLNDMKDDSRIRGKISGINLAREDIRRKVLNLREQLNNVEMEFVSKIEPNPEEIKDISQSFSERITAGLDRELKRQKMAGKKFISDQEVDIIIDGIIKDELGYKYKEDYINYENGEN